MKVTAAAIGLCLLVMASVTCVAQNDSPGVDDSFPVLTGPYLGQKPPGMKPEIFAPDVLVKPKQAHSSIVFSGEGTEAYWCHNGILFSELENGKWTTPGLVHFSKEEFSDDAPFLSPDGKRLFFTSRRPIDDSDKSRKENIWVVDVAASGWSDARPLPPVVNDMFQHWQVSVDSEGTLYFGHNPGSANNYANDIYCSRYENGEYQTPEKLGDMINTEHSEICPFISPEGDYLIFARINSKLSAGGRQDISLFISFKLQNGSWSEALDLREQLHFRYIANCPIVSQDGKYLFFLDAYEGEYQRYWISADIIDGARQSHPAKRNLE